MNDIDTMFEAFKKWMSNIDSNFVDDQFSTWEFEIWQGATEESQQRIQELESEKKVLIEKLVAAEEAANAANRVVAADYSEIKALNLRVARLVDAVSFYVDAYDCHGDIGGDARNAISAEQDNKWLREQKAVELETLQNKINNTTLVPHAALQQVMEIVANSIAELRSQPLATAEERIKEGRI